MTQDKLITEILTLGAELWGTNQIDTLRAEEEARGLITSFVKGEIDKALQDQEGKIWLEAWKAVANSESCRDYETATRWADQALRDFKARHDKNH